MTFRQKLLKTVSRQFPTLGRLRKDNSGIAAIEFAFVAPIMLAFYFGMTEIAMAIMADRNVSHATAVTADLATQLPTLNAVELSDVMTATIAVLNVPQDRLGQITIELNSFQKMTDGSVNEVGYARLGPQISSGGPANYDPNASLNDQMFNAQSGVVVARINYSYKPATLYFMDGYTMAETLVMKPRKSINVPFDEGGSTRFTCTVGADKVVNCTVSA